MGLIEREFEDHRTAILDLVGRAKSRASAYEILAALYGGKPRGWEKFFRTHSNLVKIRVSKEMAREIEDIVG